jgi:hypothetical protein
MKNDWKLIGLFCGFSAEIFFWIAYLSLLLAEIGSPLADVIWLLSGGLGIIFGIINLRSSQKKAVRALSHFTLLTGVIQLPLWVLAVFVASM